jgi:benzoyl-CoA-dihydrodiol lyase
VDGAVTQEPQVKMDSVDFQTDPSRYKHWKLSFDGPVATLTMDVAEDGGLRPGHKLKLNSYDLGVDIELHDALQRIRFEHPEVRSVVLTSAKSRIFCSGANIYMLGLSSHAWKVNFCKFTNETRNGIEDSSAHSGLKFLAALNGTTAGGGYELALACDEIVLVDDRSSAVSLPELPLLGVLPGTGGLTRVTDKRKVRRDHADIFATNPDGVRGQRAKDWRLVDDAIKPQQFAEHVKQRALKLTEQSDRPANAKGVSLTPLKRSIDEAGLHYEYVDVQFNRQARTATLTVRAPKSPTEDTLEKVLAADVTWWPLQMARELDDAILTLRAGELDLGLWIVKTTGDPDAVLAVDEFLLNHQDNWFVREVLGMMRRTFARIDVTSRSLYAIAEPGSCFAGTLLELALAADRLYVRDTQESESPATLMLSKMRVSTRTHSKSKHCEARSAPSLPPKRRSTPDS